MKIMRNNILRNSSGIAGFFFIVQGNTRLSPEQRNELLKLSIFPVLGVIAVVIIFLVVKNRMMSPQEKLNKLELDSLREDMITRADEKKLQRKSDTAETPAPEHPVEDSEKIDDKSVEGKSLT